MFLYLAGPAEPGLTYSTPSCRSQPALWLWPKTTMSACDCLTSSLASEVTAETQLKHVTERSLLIAHVLSSGDGACDSAVQRQRFRLGDVVTLRRHPDDVSQQNAPAEELQMPAEREGIMGCALVHIAPV